MPYIAWAGMVARYDKVGFFMSSWGLEDYRANGRPVFREWITAHRPLFLLTDPRALDLDRPWGESRAGGAYRLLSEDYETLVDNYLPHWGPIWVAGKRLAPGHAGSADSFTLLIPGRYRLEAEVALTIGGTLVEPGSVIGLAAGTHQVDFPPGIRDRPARLRWAAARPGPQEPPLTAPLYLGF